MNLFSRTDGRWFVDAHKYTITIGFKAVRVEDWHLFVQPGTEAEMAIIVQKVAPLNLEHCRIVCPVCHFDNFEDSLQATW